MTDMISPPPGTLAGEQLLTNMRVLETFGSTQRKPLQNVDAFNIPQHLKTGPHKMFLAGSPANNDPSGNRMQETSPSGNIRFKSEVFYSMCWNTPPDSGVGITYSMSACPGIEFWAIEDAYPGRVMMVVPAHFETYRPRLGLADSLGTLSDDPDTMIALYIPAGWCSKLQWHGTMSLDSNRKKLDVAKTLVSWLGDAGRIVTFSAFTGELEVDIVQASSMWSWVEDDNI